MRRPLLLSLLLLASALTAAPALRAQPAAEAKALTPPRLVEFAEAPYPPEALAAQREGAPVLVLDIDAEGKVTAATVVEPAGSGFDEAAQAAALRFRFEPARRGDQPTRSRIRYRYPFKLPAAAPAARDGAATPPAAPAAAPTRGRLAGRIVLHGADAPLAGARVVARLGDGTVREARTDLDGAFAMDELPPGAVAVRVEAQGYGGVEAQELVEAGSSTEVTYRLSAPAKNADEVVVKAARPDREVTRRTMERKELGLVPGTNGDALRAVQSMPGVGRASYLNSWLIVRGARPQSTAIFVDGVWVPSAFHFGGFSSVIPTESIESIDLYPGNFAARYGRATGGILEVRPRAIAPDGKYSGLAQVDLIDARAMVQGPVPGLSGWKFSLAARRSHLDAWLPSLLDGDDVSFRVAPVYYDYQGFVERRTEDHMIRIGVFGSQDAMALVTRTTSTSDPGISTGLAAREGFWRVMASYEGKLAPGLRLALTGAYGQNSERFRAGQINVWDRFHTFTLRGDLSYRVASSLTLRAGPDILYYPYEVDMHSPAPPRAGEPDPGPMSNRALLKLKGDGALSAPAFYAEADWRPVPRAKLLFGARVDYFNKNGDTNTSPRFNARYDLVQGPLRTTLRGGVGVFYEPPQPVEVVEVFGTPSVRANRSLHTSVGIEQELSTHAEVSLEGFRKDLDQLIVRGTLPDGTYGYTNAGTGRVVGLEALLRLRPGGGRVFGLVSYTLSRSVRSDAPGQQEHLLEYDQTHILTAVASVDLGRHFQLGTRFRYVTGTPYTPCVDGTFDAAVGAYACRSGAIHSARLPDFAQLDVRLDKWWAVGAGRIAAYLELVNATNRKNTEQISYNYNYSRTAPSYGLPILPNLGLRGEF